MRELNIQSWCNFCFVRPRPIKFGSTLNAVAAVLSMQLRRCIDQQCVETSLAHGNMKESVALKKTEGERERDRDREEQSPDRTCFHPQNKSDAPLCPLRCPINSGTSRFNEFRIDSKSRFSAFSGE